MSRNCFNCGRGYSPGGALEELADFRRVREHQHAVHLYAELVQGFFVAFVSLLAALFAALGAALVHYFLYGFGD